MSCYQFSNWFLSPCHILSQNATAQDGVPPNLFFFFFFTSLTTSRCAHFPQNINCWFDFSFLVSLSQKLPEVPKLPASAGIQDSQQVSIAVRFASESHGSEKHQIPPYLLWLPGIYIHTSEFRHILGTNLLEVWSQIYWCWQLQKKENSLNWTKHKINTKIQLTSTQKATKLFKTQMPTLQIAQSSLLTHGASLLPGCFLALQ